jgi:hypothetical protein
MLVLKPAADSGRELGHFGLLPGALGGQDECLSETAVDRDAGGSADGGDKRLVGYDDGTGGVVPAFPVHRFDSAHGRPLSARARVATATDSPVLRHDELPGPGWMAASRPPERSGRSSVWPQPLNAEHGVWHVRPAWRSSEGR